MDITRIIAAEAGLDTRQVQNVVDLIADTNTIPFIARYRKEKTGNLDEVQLRLVRDRWEYLTELESRKETVLKSIAEQGALTDEIQAKIREALTKQAVEDLYLPFKPKKRTRASIAREKGLEPLAVLMKTQQATDPWLAEFLKGQTGDIDEATARQGARDVLAEWIAEDADLKERIRDRCWAEGSVRTEVRKEFRDQKTKFEMYYEFNEPIRQIPAHRYLAIRRGEAESVLKISFDLPEERIIDVIHQAWIDPTAGYDDDLRLAIDDSYHRLIAPSVEVDLRLQLKTNADDDSIRVFGENLKSLLLAPLGGTRMVLGLDPGFRSGTKVVVVDATGKFLDKAVIHPVQPQNRIDEAEHILATLLDRYPCEIICIGNGTASREIMQFVRAFLTRTHRHQVRAILVNEAGASVYSASDEAREEFPDLDVSFRGAISIARRFQDPLAELVKIDPKSIGIGQYQHDVNQKKLKRSLDEVVESCVNYVGVNLNTASAALLSYVSGLNRSLAKSITAYRDTHGPYAERADLIKVPRFGPKSFEQSAGFLRIKDGINPLDASAVHPENYGLVLKMAQDKALSVSELIGKDAVLDTITLECYRTEQTGLLTLRDIINELKKPGRDPRTEFVGAKLNEDVRQIDDIVVDMELEGTVTNLTKFGAFVDIGVHHDGLIHLSEMSDHFIRDPAEVCAVGDVVKVRVLSVDLDRRRIRLTLRSKTRKKQLPKNNRSTQEKDHRKQSTTVDLHSLVEKFKGIS
jgi:protein Tex